MSTLCSCHQDALSCPARDLVSHSSTVSHFVIAVHGVREVFPAPLRWQEVRLHPVPLGMEGDMRLLLSKDVWEQKVYAALGQILICYLEGF